MSREDMDYALDQAFKAVFGKLPQAEQNCADRK